MQLTIRCILISNMLKYTYFFELMKLVEYCIYSLVVAGAATLYEALTVLIRVPHWSARL